MKRSLLIEKKEKIAAQNNLLFALPKMMPSEQLAKGRPQEYRWPNGACMSGQPEAQYCWPGQIRHDLTRHGVLGSRPWLGWHDQRTTEAAVRGTIFYLDGLHSFTPGPSSKWCLSQHNTVCEFAVSCLGRRSSPQTSMTQPV